VGGMTRLRARGTGLLVVMLLSVGLAGCATTTVSKLLAEPERWRNKDAGLKGNVVQSVSLLGRGAYQLDDGTGKIWIVSAKGVPREGARVSVKGEVKDIVDLGTLIPLPPQVGSGLVLIEKGHKAQ
jgi:hypothetical protein